MKHNFKISFYENSGKQLFSEIIPPDAIKVELPKTNGLTISVRGSNSENTGFVFQEISLNHILAKLTDEILNFQSSQNREEQTLTQAEYQRFRSNISHNEETEEDFAHHEAISRDPQNQADLRRRQILADAQLLEDDIRNVSIASQTIQELDRVLKVKLQELIDMQDINVKKHSNLLAPKMPTAEERYANIFRNMLRDRNNSLNIDNIFEKMKEPDENKNQK